MIYTKQQQRSYSWSHKPPTGQHIILATRKNAKLGMQEQHEPRSPPLYFDPDKHPENTLKVFNEFCDAFVLRYNALYPDPPKVSIDVAFERWKIGNTTDPPRNRLWRNMMKYETHGDLKTELLSLLGCSHQNGSKTTGPLLSPRRLFDQMQPGHSFSNTCKNITNPPRTPHWKTFISVIHNRERMRHLLHFAAASPWKLLTVALSVRMPTAPQRRLPPATKSWLVPGTRTFERRHFSSHGI